MISEGRPAASTYDTFGRIIKKCAFLLSRAQTDFSFLSCPHECPPTGRICALCILLNLMWLPCVRADFSISQIRRDLPDLGWGGRGGEEHWWGDRRL